MFYCEPCRILYEWPESITKSYGPCEVCKITAGCHDRPSGTLSSPKPKPTIAAERSYDSSGETKQHIRKVWFYLEVFAAKLERRGEVHDKSKLEEPELKVFDEYTPKLKDTPYGSEEYKANTAAMKPALDHHYANNSHHPQHYENGINGMDLLDIVEMMCDWKAAGERNKGDMRKSLEINAERFGISKQLRQILENTIERMEW